MSLMDDNGELKSDLEVPGGDIGKEMNEKFKNDEEVLVSTKTPHNINLARQSKIQSFSLNNSFLNLLIYNSFLQVGHG